MHRLGAALCAVALFGVLYAAAWGDYTHQLMACDMIEGQLPQPPPSSFRCLSTPENASFVLGSSSPDAVKYAYMQLHSFEFATFLVQFAAAHADDPTYAPLDPLHFALGFGSHIAEDAVAHHSHGYLADVATQDHEQEFAVDTFMFKHTMAKDYPDFQFLTEQARQLLLNASTAYAAAYPAVLPAVSNDTLSAAEDKFEAEMREEGVLLRVNIVYELEMKEWDTCGATSTSDALVHFARARTDSELAAAFWRAAAQAPSATPAQVAADSAKFVETLYAKNPCA